MTASTPIDVEGVTFESVAAAARAHNVTASTVRNARRRGRLHTLGHGQGCKRVSVLVGVTVYENRDAAALALGVPVRTIGSWLTVQAAIARKGTT
jgi:transposase-like protein